MMFPTRVAAVLRSPSSPCTHSICRSTASNPPRSLPGRCQQRQVCPTAARWFTMYRPRNPVAPVTAILTGVASRIARMAVAIRDLTNRGQRRTPARGSACALAVELVLLVRPSGMWAYEHAAGGAAYGY